MEVIRIVNSSSSDTLRYQWSFSSKPNSSVAALASPNSVETSFTADANGIYTLDLTVTDESFLSSTSNVDIAIMPIQSYSGPDQSVKTGATVQLDGLYTLRPNLAVDGSLRFSIEGVSFSWSFVSVPPGSTAVMSDSNLIEPTFVADKQGEYLIALEVYDGFVTTSDQLIIVAYNMKANAGYDQFIETSVVQLDASGSWSINGDLQYAWSVSSMPIGSNAVMSDSTIVNPTFTVDVEGEYVFDLNVNVGALTDTSSVSVTVMPWLPRNITVAIDDQIVKTGDLVQLDASASMCGMAAATLPNENPNGSTSSSDGVIGGIDLGCRFDPATSIFSWTYLSKPVSSNATLNEPNIMAPTFTADVMGDYVVQLNLDYDGNISTDELTVTATDLHADAGFDQMQEFGMPVLLDGNGSWNVNGSLFYEWSIISSPAGSGNVLISNSTQAIAELTPNVEGDYEIKLLITDGATNIDSDNMLIRVFNFPGNVVGN